MNRTYKIPVLIRADDTYFDRFNHKKEHNGWLFYIGGALGEGYKIVAVTPEEMASRGVKEHLLEIPIQNDRQFLNWVKDFIVLNQI